MHHASPISHRPDYLRITKGKVIRNGKLIADIAGGNAADMYRALGFSYPKFFKMDSLCKWAWIGAEALLRKDTDDCLYNGLDKTKVALVLSTTDGCLEVDKRYAETLQTIPSPALFVYTLPNIMLGEICIRHGFTGDQLCEVQEGFDAEELLFLATDLLANRGATHCLFGMADAVDEHHDVCLFWADVQRIRTVTAKTLQSVYDTQL